MKKNTVSINKRGEKARQVFNFCFVKTVAILFCVGFLFYCGEKPVYAATDCTNTGVTGISQTECEALIALYDDTNGSSWTNSSNWNTASAVITWYGVAVTAGHVTTLNLNSNNLVGAIPSEIGSLTSLTSLNFSLNQLSGSVPTAIGNLTKLVTLNLYANQLSGSIPTEISSLTLLTTIYLHSNSFTGTIPDIFGGMTSLATLYLSANTSLSYGSLPSNLPASLVTLVAASSKLSGEIPASICNMTGLVTLSLYDNQMTGSIPSCFSNLTSLVTLNIYTNLLTGTIPSGLSSTLRTLSVYGNQLSGTIPADIASIPLTTFKIQNNNFVFSNFESQFGTYNGYGTFTYSPQSKVDTVRTITVIEGQSLSITPSVAANTNDIYQWYKDSVAISGATSRVYTKAETDASDIGVYTYTITNSVVGSLTLQSNNITINITPSPPTADSVYYIVGANSTWVRGAISSNKDIAQNYVTFGATNNQTFNFGTAYIISSSTPNSTTKYTAGTSIATSGDDATPINTLNAGYFMSGHGLNSPVVTSVGHDKTSDDIGSTWSDGTYQFILAGISGNALTFYSIPSGSPWSVRTSVLGTLIHVTGSTHTSNITVTSQAAAQQYPAVKNVVYHILADGTTEITNGDSGYADYVDISEEFDLIDPSTIDRTNNPFVWNDATGVWMHVKNVFHTTAGRTIVHSTYEIESPINLGYFGIIQVGPLSAPSYDHQYFYVPKTKPIGEYDFEAPQLLDSAPASQVTFDSASIDDADNPPDRQIVFFKNDEDSNYDIGFAFGYSPYGATAAASRNCASYANGCWWIYTTKKTYPVMVGGLGVVNNVTYDAYAYRQWIDPTLYDVNKSVYWNDQGDHDLVYVDYHRSASSDETALPSEFIGKAIKVVDSLNIQTPAAIIPANGNLSLSTTGANTYGYAVFELTTAPSTPVSPAFSTATSTTSLVANWTSGGSTGDNGYTLDISAANDCTSFINATSGLATSTVTYSKTGLVSNTKYCFRVAATSDSLATSAYATSSAKYTLADTPTNLSASLSYNNITLSVDSFSNHTSGLSGYYFSRSGANSGWIQTNSWQDTGLSCGNTYTYSVKYRNGDGVETDSVSITKSTGGCGGGVSAGWSNLPTTPIGGFKVLVNSGDNTTANRIINLNFNASPDVKKMAISLTGDFSDAVQEDYQPTKQFDICSKFGGFIKNPICPPGQYMVYIKFYTVYGTASSVVSQKINLVAAPSKNISAVLQNLLSSSAIFKNNFSLGTQSKDVRRLQELLATKLEIYPEGLVTGYFGVLTKKAIQRFQLKYNVVSSRFDAGFGLVGPKTRAKLKEAFNNI